MTIEHMFDPTAGSSVTTAGDRTTGRGVSVAGTNLDRPTDCHPGPNSHWDPAPETELAWEASTAVAAHPGADPNARVPVDLDSWEPGLFSHAVLTTVDREALSGRELVTVLRTEARLIAHLEALHAQTIAQLAVVDPADPDADTRLDEFWEEASDELGAALTLTRRGAGTRLGEAIRLVEHQPVWQALAEGRLDRYRANLICEAVSGIDSTTARRIVDQVIEAAPTMTSGQLRARIKRLVIAVDPDAAEQRYRQGVADRRVVVTANDDTTADLWGCALPSDRVAEARDRIERIARSLKTSDEARTLDQLRADVFLDLLCGTADHPTAKGTVDITVDLATLAGLAGRPAEIPGWGPVIADLARRLAAEHGRQWQITLTHQQRPVWVGTTRRRPDTGLTRRVRARHRRCVFPGCRMPARRCDLDHRIPWCDGGPTCEHNLAPLCRHHHGLRVKGWDLHRLPEGGHRWTSPLGWSYTTRPPPN